MDTSTRRPVLEAYRTALAREDVRRTTLAGEIDLVPHVEQFGGPDALRLAEVVRVHAGRVLATVGFEPEADALSDGMLVWDARFAGYLDTLGPVGAEIAAKIRRRSADVWLDESGTQLRLYAAEDGIRLWRPESGVPVELASPWRLWWLWETDGTSAPKWLLALADAVWAEEVQPAVDREAATVAPALLRPVASSVARLRPPRVEGGRLVDDMGESVLAPLVPLDAIESRGLQAIGSILGPRVCEWQAEVLWRRAVEGDQSATVEVVGGFQAFAEQLGAGADGGRIRKELGALLSALMRVRFQWDAPAGFGDLPLLSGFELEHETRGRPALLRLHLSPLWWPNTVNRIRMAGGQRRIVPIVPEPRLTRQDVHAGVWAAAGRLHRQGVGALIAGTDEWRKHGAVRIPWVDLVEPALRAHLPRLLGSPGWLAVWAVDAAGRWTLRRDRPENERAIRLLEQFKPPRGKRKRR